MPSGTDSRDLARREFLHWLCKIGSGVAAFTLTSGVAPLRRINTVLFPGAARAQEGCAEDTCTQRDACQTGDAGHLCQQRDVCDTDESGDCENDACTADNSNPCKGDQCAEDKSGSCNSDQCESDKSGACVSDKCSSDKSGGCVSDCCNEDKSNECVSDACISDSSGACVSDTCASDSSGACRSDGCSLDSSGACKSDRCLGDNSGACQSDKCVSDRSGACVSDTCSSDESGACSADTCLRDRSGACVSDECRGDFSQGCAGDGCTTDESGACETDACSGDGSAACKEDQCGQDSSGECNADSCVTDRSSQCISDACDVDDRQCPSDATCALDGICLMDSACLDDGCFLDELSLEGCVTDGLLSSRRDVLNRAIRWLYRTCGIVLLFSLLWMPGPAEAADIAVPSGNVPALKAAIETANSNGEADTISLGAGDYVLTSTYDDIKAAGLPSITSVITINGAGTGTTVIRRDAAAPAFRILHVAPGGDLTLNRVKIQGGEAPVGGGILNEEGILALNRCTVSGNTAWDEEYEQDGDGGGIANFMGAVFITDSAVSGNTAQGDTGVGGGLSSLGGAGVALVNTTAYGNAAESTDEYFGIAIGGGLSIIGGDAVELTNVTVSGNTAHVPEGDEDVVSFGGGVVVIGDLALRNSIVALNEADYAPDIFSCGGGSEGHNLIGDPTGSFLDLIDTDLTGDPGLGEFTDNGEPGNGHLPLLATSPAIDRGDPEACSDTDQVSEGRVGTCDIGAVEYLKQILAPVPSLGGWGGLFLSLMLAVAGYVLVWRQRRSE